MPIMRSCGRDAVGLMVVNQEQSQLLRGASKHGVLLSQTRDKKDCRL